MQFLLTARACRDYESLSLYLKKRADKQFAFLLRNLHHPSLHAKKYNKISGMWQARVNRNYRFYFLIKNEAYKIISIIPHPK